MYTGYIKYLLLRPKFCPFALRPTVSKISHILSFPIDYHVKRPKKEQNYLPKIQNFKFHYSFNNFVRDPPQEYTIILWSKSGVSFQRRCRLKLLPLYGPILTKMKKKMVKIQCLKFHNSLSNFGIDPF